LHIACQNHTYSKVIHLLVKADPEDACSVKIAEGYIARADIVEQTTSNASIVEMMSIVHSPKG
jgi:hypothetical protein